MAVGLYADESETTDEVFTLAGFIASPSAWNRFVPKWREMLSDTGPYPVDAFHSADIEAARPPFDGWPIEDRQQLVTNALGLLTDVGLCANLYAVSSTFMLKDFKVLDSRLLGDGSIAAIYELCYRVLFYSILNTWPFNGIEFIFDDKEKVKGRVRNHFERSKAALEKTEQFKGKLGGCHFRDDRKEIPLQAADLLAYEVRRDAWTRLSKGNDARTRSAYQLIKDSFPVKPEEGQPQRQRLFRCYNKEFFDGYFEKAARFPQIKDEDFIDLWYFGDAPEE